jgi:hypothetical protein
MPSPTSAHSSNIAPKYDCQGPYVAARVFPLWVIIGVILLWGLTVLEIFIKIRLPEAFSTTAVIIGACLALGVLLWADCALYVNLPFAEPVCHLVGF